MAFKKLKFWFDKDLARLLADKILVVQPNFKDKSFIKNIDAKVHDLELKDRIAVFADELHEQLSNNYAKNIKILMKILGPENKEGTGMFSNFYWIMPIAYYVEKYGLDDFKMSMQAIEAITKRNTSEYAIRPFLERYPEKTLAQMIKWSTDKNFHVRRLSSEGIRPRLPWAKKMDAFIDNPTPILPILNNLKDDPEKYVQKSVANCLNDLVKDNLPIAKKMVEKWQKKPTPERRWIIKHGLRRLLKADDKWAQQMVK